MENKKDHVVRVYPGRMQGKVLIPPSKSLSHRAIMAASLTDDVSSVGNVVLSQDILATMTAMETMGAKIERSLDDNGRTMLTIQGIFASSTKPKQDRLSFHCRESGSTLRFIIPLAMLFGKQVQFDGTGKLVERPLDVYTELFAYKEVPYVYEHQRLPLIVSGDWVSGIYPLRGDVSSQFITGLLFTLPLLPGDSEIRMTTPLESRGYVDLTLDMLARFGIEIIEEDQRFLIPGGQRYRACDVLVEGDYSQSIFFLLGGILSGPLEIEGLSPTSRQGDAVILELLERMQADVSFADDDSLLVRPGCTKSLVVDCNEFPDLVPALAVLCALSEGTSHLTHLERLKIKESDRLEAVYQNLKALGVEVERDESSLTIQGRQSFHGTKVDGWNDHRMVMSMAMAALANQGYLDITDPECVSKSYPDFWKDYKALGGIIDEWRVG